MERTTVGSDGQGEQIAATNNAATSGRIDMRGWAFGMVKVPTSITAIAWYHARTADSSETPTAIEDAAGDPVASVALTAGNWTPIPSSCAGAAFLVPVLTGAATGTIYVIKKG